MGVDVNLYVEADVSPERLAAAENLLRERCRIADEYIVDGEAKWSILEARHEDWFPRPRIEMNVTARYYGDGYERGDWPSIYGAIRLMQALFPESPVFYGGDTTDDGEECTAEFLAEMWNHFVGPHGNAYREFMRAMTSIPGGAS